MSNFYSSNQQSGGGFYNQSSDAYGQQQQQQQQPFGGYNNPNTAQQQWQSTPNQWQSNPQPQQNQQQQPTSQPQQQQQPQQSQTDTTGAGFWNPSTAMAAVAGSMATGGGFSNDAMLDLASSAGKTFLQSGSARMIPGLESAMISLRSYFAVDNKYVLTKMKKVLVPFLSKEWRRQIKEPGQQHGAPPQYELPTIDENAPDLYLPFMSLITYVLLCALCYGNAGQFNPEVIPDVTTKCIITQVLEVLAIRFGFYAMQVPIAVLDLFSYTSYKYLGLCVNMFVGLILGHFGFGTRGYYATFLWTASACSFFMLKTMANNIPLETASTGPKREVMVVVFAASQFATMWFVSQTKFL